MRAIADEGVDRGVGDAVIGAAGLGQAKPCVAMRLGAPRRLLHARHGRIGGTEAVGVGGTALCRRQAGQSLRVRGLSSRWRIAVADVVSS